MTLLRLIIICLISSLPVLANIEKDIICEINSDELVVHIKDTFESNNKTEIESLINGFTACSSTSRKDQFLLYREFHILLTEKKQYFQGQTFNAPIDLFYWNWVSEAFDYYFANDVAKEISAFEVFFDEYDDISSNLIFFYGNDSVLGLMSYGLGDVYNLTGDYAKAETLLELASMYALNYLKDKLPYDNPQVDFNFEALAQKILLTQIELKFLQNDVQGFLAFSNKLKKIEHYTNPVFVTEREYVERIGYIFSASAEVADQFYQYKIFRDFQKTLIEYLAKQDLAEDTREDLGWSMMSQIVQVNEYIKNRIIKSSFPFCDIEIDDIKKLVNRENLVIFLQDQCYGKNTLKKEEKIIREKNYGFDLENFDSLLNSLYLLYSKNGNSDFLFSENLTEYLTEFSIDSQINHSNINQLQMFITNEFYASNKDLNVLIDILLNVKLPDIENDFREIIKNETFKDSTLDTYINYLEVIKETFVTVMMNSNESDLPEGFTAKAISISAMYYELATRYGAYQMSSAGPWGLEKPNLSKIKDIVGSFLETAWYVQYMMNDYQIFNEPIKTIVYLLATVEEDTITDHMRFSKINKGIEDQNLRETFSNFIDTYKSRQLLLENQITSENMRGDFIFDDYSSKQEFLDAQNDLSSAVDGHKEAQIFSLPSYESMDDYFRIQTAYLYVLQKDENIFVIDIRRSPSGVDYSFTKLDINLTEATEYMNSVKTYPPLANFNELHNKVSDSLTRYYEPCNPMEKNLYIIPSQDLKEFPFHTLKIDHNRANFKNEEAKKDYKYLIETCNISYLPSIQSIFHIDSFSLNINKMSFVGFGNPAFTESSFKQFKKRGLANISQLKRLLALEESEEEILSIGKLFSDSKIFVKENANEKKLKSLSYEPDSILYFATHSLPSNNIITNEPGLALSPPNLGTNIDDGVITYEEISKLNLSDSYISLSACNTYDALYSGAEKYTGLPSAFFAAGAKGIILSMWDIESFSAVKFNKSLYTNLTVDKVSFQEAISKASLELINTEEYSHPFFWGPYFYMGAHPTFINFPLN